MGLADAPLRQWLCHRSEEVISDPAVIGAVIVGSSTLLAAWLGLRSRSVARDRRIDKARGRLRLTCPHVEVACTADGDLAVRALPMTPFGSLFYFCGHCGGAFHGETVEQIRDDWLRAIAADPTKALADYQKGWKSAARARKRLERLGGGQ